MFKPPPALSMLVSLLVSAAEARPTKAVKAVKAKTVIIQSFRSISDLKQLEKKCFATKSFEIKNMIARWPRQDQRKSNGLGFEPRSEQVGKNILWSLQR